MKLLILFTLIFITACAGKIKEKTQEKAKEIKYSAYELVGYEKRDLFKKEVNSVKENQEESQIAFKDALEQLQYFYSFEGGELEREYNKLKKTYERSLEESQSLLKSIDDLDTIATDLFNEWQKEINQISSPKLRKNSSQKLIQTQNKYAELQGSLKKSERNIPPVLTKIKDQVLYLKHNLNASAIEGLKDEGNRIRNEISILIDEMEKANKEAQEFIETL